MFQFRKIKKNECSNLNQLADLEKHMSKKYLIKLEKNWKQRTGKDFQDWSRPKISSAILIEQN